MEKEVFVKMYLTEHVQFRTFRMTKKIFDIFHNCLLSTKHRDICQSSLVPGLEAYFEPDIILLARRPTLSQEL